jgi:hypothetical protein
VVSQAGFAMLFVLAALVIVPGVRLVVRDAWSHADG